jgi:hypothetical protein
MRGMTLGTAPAMLVSPKGRLPAFWLAMMALALMAGGSVAGRAAEADPNEVLDVSHMPRLPGAQDDAAHTSFGSLTYTVAGSVASATAAAKKLLADDGWQQYESPSDDSNTSLLFKKGPRGIYVSFTMVGGKTDQSSVNYLGNRLNRDLPFPAEATEIVYNGNRPYLSCITAGTVDTSLAFYRRELLALGWARLSATEAAARWPDADLGEKVKNGVADYFVRENQLPIVLLLQRPRGRPDQCRDQSRAVCAAAGSRGRGGSGRSAGAEASHQLLGLRWRSPARAESGGAGGDRHRAGVLSRRARQAQMEGRGSWNRPQSGRGCAGLFLGRRHIGAKARPQI